MTDSKSSTPTFKMPTNYNADSTPNFNILTNLHLKTALHNLAVRLTNKVPNPGRICGEERGRVGALENLSGCKKQKNKADYKRCRAKCEWPNKNKMPKSF